MRSAILSLIAIAATACGQSSTPPEESLPAIPGPAPAQIDLATLQGRIVALGRNPEWRLDADAQLGLVLTAQQQGLTFSAPFAAPQRIENGGARLASAPLTVTLTPAPCSIDGVAYPMSSSVQVEQGEPLTGCAFVRWDWRLTELLPAIDSCISRSPLTRRVTYAAREADNSILVRLQGGENPPVDCRATPTPGAPVIITPADANLRVAGESDAIFVRAMPAPSPGLNPGGECYEAPEVRAADGSLLGWMDDPLGC